MRSQALKINKTREEDQDTTRGAEVEVILLLKSRPRLPRHSRKRQLIKRS